MSGEQLYGLNLAGADLYHGKLSGSFFEYAIFEMTDVKGLETVKNLDQAVGLDDAKGLPPQFQGFSKP